MTETRGPARRERILDAAEAAFADLGFAGTSLRHVVQAAGVNLATVYYYFQSKEGLMEAVLARRFGPLQAEHLKGLRAAEAEADGQPLAVEAILESMLRPPLRLAITAPKQGPAVTRLLGRIVTEPNPQTQEFLRRRHLGVRTAFLEAMQRALPDLPLPVLRWRLEFVWGALGFILCNPRRLEKETHGACNPIQTDCVVAEMIAFFAPGFKNPNSTRKSSKAKGQSPKSKLGRMAA